MNNFNNAKYRDHLRVVVEKRLGEGFHLVALQWKTKIPYKDSEGHQLEIRSIEDFDNIMKAHNLINIGIYCKEYEPGYLIVIDVDNKHGKNGFKFLEENNINLDELNTYTETSPNNGTHYFFWSPMRETTVHYDCGIDVLGLPTDENGTPSYCLCYPSIAMNEESNKYEMYNIVNNAEIQEAGEEIYNLLYVLEKNCGSISKKPQITNNSDGDQVIPCGTRDDTIFNYAMMFRDNGFNMENSYKLLNIINKNLCEVPLSDSIVKQKVKSAFGREPRTKKKIKEDTPALESKEILDALVSPYDLKNEVIDWIIPDYIPRGTTCVIAGDGGVGKSYLVFSIASAISTGKPCFFEESQERREKFDVAYFSNEDMDAVVKQRSKTLEIDPEHFFVISNKSDIVSRIDFNMIEILEEVILTGHFDVLIFDPIQSFVPWETNMATRNQMRAILEPLMNLAARTDTAIIIVCHTNKSLKAGGRGRVADSADIYDCTRNLYMIGTVGDGRNYFSHEKANMGHRNKTVLYTQDDKGKLHFSEYSDLNDAGFIREKNNYFKGQDEEKKEEKAQSQIDMVCEEILQILEVHQDETLTSTDLKDFVLELVPGTTTPTYQRALSRLVAYGRIKKMRGSQYGLKGNSYVYVLADNEEEDNIDNSSADPPDKPPKKTRAVVVLESRDVIRYFESVKDAADFYEDKGVTKNNIYDWCHGSASSKLPFYQFIYYDDLTKRGKKYADKAKETGVYYTTEEDIKKGIL